MTRSDRDTQEALRNAIRALDRQAVHLERNLAAVHLPPRLDDLEELDHFEALTARFGRLQDMLLAPFRLIAMLELEERRLERVRDLLNFMEKLGIVPSAADWLAMRRVRNAIAHEYWQDVEQLRGLLELAARYSRDLITTLARAKAHAAEKLGITFGL
ncbi:MAG: hypothetical protein ACHBMF_07085 [Chromatiales bacterium]